MNRGLKSANLKLKRAAKHLRSIRKRIAAYARTKPHKIVRKSNSKKKLNIPKAPPIKIAILAGEMVYQMRSALDHLAFELIKQNPDVATIDPDWGGHCQFPIRTDVPKGCTPPLSKKRFANDLPGIADGPFAFIERVQPYYRVGAINNVLRLLSELSNIDKHRHLHLLRARVKQFESVRYPGGLSSVGHSTLDRGAEIRPQRRMSIKGPPEKAVYVKRSYRALVALDEKAQLGEVARLPVDQLLEIILDHIKTILMPAFTEFLEGSEILS